MIWHKHEWKTTKRSSKPIYARENYGTWRIGESKPIAHAYVVYQQCKKCGKEIARRFNP